MSRNPRNIPKSTKYDSAQLAEIQSVSQLLESFLRSKIKDHTKYFFSKIKLHNIKKKKYGKLLSHVLGGVASRKKKEHLKHGFGKLQANMISERGKIVREFMELDQKVKGKAANLIGTILGKIYTSKMKQSFRHLMAQSRASYNAKNFKVKHLTRIFNKLLIKKY